MRGIRFIAVVAAIWMAATATASASGHNITISTGATMGFSPIGPPATYTAIADNANLNIGELNTALAGAGDVSVDTTTLSGQPGNVTITAPITWSTANRLTITAAGDTTFASAPLTASSPGSGLTLDNGIGGIHAGSNPFSPIIVAGATTIIAPSGQIDLRLAANDFNQLKIQAAGFAVNIQEANAIQLAGVNASSFVTLSAGGPITQSNAVTIGGPASLGSGASLTLGDPTNSFADSLSAFGTQVTLNTAGNLQLGTVGASDLNVTAGGAITQTGVITALGQFGAQGSSVTLANPANDFSQALVDATAGALSLRDANSITLNGVTATGAAQVIANLNLTAGSTSNGSPLTLVADEAAGSGLGAGGITILPNAVLTSTGAPVRLYTARRSQNSIAANATLNGATFTPGPEFIDSAREVWATRFPAGTAANPFTVFYKQAGRAPETTIDSGPADGSTTNDPTPTFTFSSSEPGSSFACSVDGESFSACTSPQTLAELADGSHTFEVTATDAAGNAYPTPASRTFTVDATPPETAIDSGPAAGSTISDPTPTFAFRSSEPGSSFACSVDGGEFSACSSPHTLAHLADGSHAFAVTTIDAAGNSDPTPTSRAFTVDATAPHGTITKGPKKKVKTTHRKVKVTFKFTSPEPGVVFLCSMDGVAATPCDSPKTYKVGTGEHRFVLLTADAHDNIDLAGDSRVFKVKRMPKHH